MARYPFIVWDQFRYHVCTAIFPVVTCDPPEAVAHATYAPVQPEHDYNTAVTFTCDIDHHYVSGNYTSVCTHLETWTETLLNCSGTERASER